MSNITNLINNIRKAIFGKDVRESIASAIEQCYEDAAKNDNANMEVIDARGTYSTLRKRLDNSDNKKADSAQVESMKNNLQSQINSLTSGSPLVASSVSEMTNTNKTYVNTTDGYWYYYNGSAWVKGGEYQAVKIADDSVTINKLSYEFKRDTNNYLDYTQILTNTTFTPNTSATYNDIANKEGYYLYNVIPVQAGETYIALDENGNGVYIAAVGYFDNKGFFISYEAVNKNKTITIPNNCNYVRFATITDDVKQFKKTDVKNYTEKYEPYKYNLTINTDLNNDVIKLKKMTSLNEDLIENTYIDTNGIAVTNSYSSIYLASNFIKVLPGFEVTIENFSTLSSCSLCAYDVEQKFIETLLNEGTNGTEYKKYTFIVPNNCHYIRYTVRDYVKNENIIYYSDSSSVFKKLNDLELNINNLLNTSVRTPIISLIDDDTNLNSIPNIKSICDDLNVKCTFACITSLINPAVNESADELIELLKSYQLEGFHITTHSNTHGTIWDSRLQDYNVSACESDLIKSLLLLQSNGFLNSDYLVTPYGERSLETQKIVSKWCKTLISSYGGTNHLGKNGRFDINRVFIQSSNTLNYYKECIDKAYDNGDWLIFGTHSGISSEFNAGLVKSVLEYAISKGIEIMPINQAWNIRKHVYDLYEKFK